MNANFRFFGSSIWLLIGAFVLGLSVLAFLGFRFFSEDPDVKYTISSAEKAEKFYSLQSEVESDLATYRRILGKNVLDVQVNACVLRINDHFNNDCSNRYQRRGQTTTIDLREVRYIEVNAQNIEFWYNERTRNLRDQTGELTRKLYKHYREIEIEKINRERLHKKLDDTPFIPRLYAEVEQFMEDNDLQSFAYLHECYGRSSVLLGSSYADRYLLRFDAPQSVLNKLTQYHAFCLRNSEADIERYTQ